MVMVLCVLIFLGSLEKLVMDDAKKYMWINYLFLSYNDYSKWIMEEA